MASKTQASPLAERIEAHFGKLTTLVETGEQASGEMKPVLSFVQAANSFLRYVDGVSADDAITLSVTMGENLAPALASIDVLREVAQNVGQSVGADRTEGDEIVAAFRAVMTLGWENAGLDDETEKAEALITRWAALAPKSSGSSSSGTSKSEPFGFTFQSKCGKCGKTFSRSSGTTNSVRWQLQDHEKSAHQNLDTAKGSDFFTGVSAALSDLAADKTNLVIVGDWTIERVNAR